VNTPNQTNAAAMPARASGMSLDDVLFTLFRHKWLVLCFVFLGIVGALVVRVVRPPPYVSNAKLMVHYVVDSRGSTTASAEGQNVKSVDFGAPSIINAEIEILTSRDVATQVVATVGSERILAKKGGGSDPMAAAGVVCSGIGVEPPKGSIITVSFKHPDADLVQPVLNALIHGYMLKHLEVRGGGGEMLDYYVKQRDDLRRKLAETEVNLKRLKTEANVLFLEDTKHAYQSQIAKAHEQLMDAERELQERQAVLGNLGAGLLTQGTTNEAESALPPEKLSDYGEITTQLDTLRKYERELLVKFKDAHPAVQGVKGQMAALSNQKAALEQAFPTLKQVALGGGLGSTNAPGGDVSAQVAEIKRLHARVGALGIILSNVQAEATHVLDMEPQITELERLHTEQQKSYDLVVTSLDQSKKGESMVAGNVINMSVVENPTPPGLDTKKLKKLMGAVLAGCIGMGVGLAFLIDLVLDRTINRSVDVERHLRVPVWLTIPDTEWNSRLRWGWLPGSRAKRAIQATATNGNGSGPTQTALAPWDPTHQLQSYAEGLRERVMTFFETNNLASKRPKLVAVAGCGHGAGVSTLASGLAAELSKTGDGNVLLVDVNGNQGAAHSFHKGKPGCGVAEVLEADSRAEGLVQEHLYVASLQIGTGAELAMVLPKRFSHLVPKLKASDYEYIVFDMPPVSPTSATPRLASHMDITLLVLESGETGQQVAARASALMRGSRANVAAVLNKHRPQAPASMVRE
jgi:polysaccharide biosynthesis transport protein